MFFVDVYSEGDLFHDDYLVIHDPESGFSDQDGYRPKFLDFIDVSLRKELLTTVIKRCAIELDHINQLDDKLIGLISYGDLVNEKL